VRIPDASLAEARKKAADARLLKSSGIDPLEAKKAELKKTPARSHSQHAQPNTSRQTKLDGATRCMLLMDRQPQKTSIPRFWLNR